MLAKEKEGPVLKHGPRSLAVARVDGWQTRKRSESTFISSHIFLLAKIYASKIKNCSRERMVWSAAVRTRKMVNYAWRG